MTAGIADRPAERAGDVVAFFRRIGPYFRPWRGPWLGALAALIAVHGIEILIPLGVQRAVDRIAAQGDGLAEAVLAVLGLALLRFLALNVGRRRNALVSIGLTTALRQAFYEHLQTLGRGFYARHGIGDLMARATSDIAAIQRFFRFAVHQLISLASVVLIAPAFMAAQSPELTLWLLPLLAAMGWSGWRLAGRLRTASAASQTAYGALTETVQQNLGGIRSIHAHAQEAREIRHFRRVATDYAGVVRRLSRWQALLAALMGLLCGLMSLVVVAVGGRQVLAGTMSVGTLAAFILYLGMILGVLRNCGHPIYVLLNASTAARRVFRILDEQPEIDEPAAGPAPATPASACGELRVEALSFAYPARGAAGPVTVLDGIGLHIRPGEMHALIGPIGCGKSTLLGLLARRLAPTAGRIALDGRGLESLPLDYLRRQVAFVTQDSFLFATSIGENISFDDPGRPPEPVAAVARVARLESTIAAFPDGFATRVGERGITLSGGQKQRTVLARNLIFDAPVLLLDDCFSALDTETAAAILAELRARRPRPTIVLASHRLATVREADCIHVMEGGRIVESGRHEALLAGAGHYAERVEP